APYYCATVEAWRSTCCLEMVLSPATTDYAAVPSLPIEAAPGREPIVLWLGRVEPRKDVCRFRRAIPLAQQTDLHEMRHAGVGRPRGSGRRRCCWLRPFRVHASKRACPPFERQLSRLPLPVGPRLHGRRRGLRGRRLRPRRIAPV